LNSNKTISDLKFAVLITTKNRVNDLILTLNKIAHIINQDDVECYICDDGSTDGTFEKVKENFPKIIVFRNETSKGLLFSRNMLLGKTTAKFAISLDDDAHFLSDNPLEEIETYFNDNTNCGLIAFRIYWGIEEPTKFATVQTAQQVQGYVGCGHVWRMSAWNSIPNYPEWFVFYGEEQFASYQLFKNNWQIHYLPSVLIQHRVDIIARKSNHDYSVRQRRSFRSGWYLYFLFYPMSVIPKKLLYTLWIQIKLKTLKGDFKSTFAIFQALGDVTLNFPKLLRQRNPLTLAQYNKIKQLPESKIYWKPNED
jgi:glycosyltransferase involved in cell wall biosynthesis